MRVYLQGETDDPCEDLVHFTVAPGYRPFLDVAAEEFATLVAGDLVMSIHDTTIEALVPGSGAGRDLVIAASDAADGNTDGGHLLLRPGKKSGAGIDGSVDVQAASTTPGGPLMRWLDFGGSVLSLIDSAGNGRFNSSLYLDGTQVLFRAGGSLLIGDLSSASPSFGLSLHTDDTPRITIAANGQITVWDGGVIHLGTATGTILGTSDTQKLAFWGSSPVVQQILATGGGATVDDVITFLQSIGLCKQS